MKIISNYRRIIDNKRQLKGGDIVYMRATAGACDFYGIYCRNHGIVDVEHCSDVYAKTSEKIFVGDKINDWIVEKVFDNCELIIKE